LGQHVLSPRCCAGCLHEGRASGCARRLRKGLSRLLAGLLDWQGVSAPRRCDNGSTGRLAKRGRRGRFCLGDSALELSKPIHPAIQELPLIRFLALLLQGSAAAFQQGCRVVVDLTQPSAGSAHTVVNSRVES
jgi:hypothetical protein